MPDKIEMKVHVEAPPARVFEALTESSELEQWFAEKAFVSQEEKRYDFWGRFTPGAPGEDDGRHRLVVYEADAKLGFDWRFRGDDTRVDIALEPTAKGTLLKLEQHIPARSKTECSVGDFWLLSFENLRRFVEDGATAVRCDYSTAPRGSVELVVDIGAPREEVFRALTVPEQINRWIAKNASIELEVGGRFDYGWDGEGPVKIVELFPNEKLVHTWRHGSDPETITSWTLEGSGGRTRLHLVHSGFGDDRGTEDFRTGWLKHIVWLKSMLEKGDAWRGPELVSADWDEV